MSESKDKILKHTPQQLKFHQALSSGRYDEGWLAGGNSAGKTWAIKFLGVHWACYKFKPRHTWTNQKKYQSTPYNILCTGPENKQAMELWEAIEEGFLQSPILSLKVDEIHTGTRRKIHPYIKLKNGTLIEAVGLHDKGKHVEGQAYDLILIQEPADIRHLLHCYEKVLTPRTWRRGGVIVGVGTPKGKGEYYQLWRKGKKVLSTKDNPYWDEKVYSQYADSRSNPYAAQEKISRFLETKNEELIQERIEGRFTDSSYAAFKDKEVAKVIDEEMKEEIAPATNHEYLHGVDFGRKVDYTCCVTWDVSVHPHRQVNFYRKGGGYITWEEIFGDLLKIYQRYGGEFVVDSTASSGDMQSEWLADLDIPFIPFQFAGSPAKKVSLINNLQDYVSRKQFLMPYISQMVEELHMYPGDLQDKGMETDTVMSLALVAYGAREYGPLGPAEPVYR